MRKKKHDLRDDAGKPGVTPDRNDLKFAGDENRKIVPDSGEHAVNPTPGSRAGMAEGQVTKSN